MKIKMIATQLKREIWEHKVGFIYVPIGVTILLLILLAFVVIKLNASVSDRGILIQDKVTIVGGYDGVQGPPKDFSELISSAANVDANVFGNVVVGATGGNFVFLSIILIGVLLGYSHSCLFDDRKNRDILFWRSMPVSETTNVLIKLVFFLFFLPIVTLVLNLILAVICIVSATVFFVAHSVSFTALMVSLFHAKHLGFSFELFFGSMLVLLLLMPFIGFIFFCSALAKKSPFLTSSLIPAVLVVADKMLQSVADINLHVIDTLSAYSRAFLNLKPAFFPSESVYWNQDVIVSLLLSWIIGSAFIAAAIWLRNNRYEI